MHIPNNNGIFYVQEQSKCCMTWSNAIINRSIRNNVVRIVTSFTSREPDMSDEACWCRNFSRHFDRKCQIKRCDFVRGIKSSYLYPRSGVMYDIHSFFMNVKNRDFLKRFHVIILNASLSKSICQRIHIAVLLLTDWLVLGTHGLL